MDRSLEQLMVLLSLPGCGAAAYWNLMDSFGSVEKAFEACARCPDLLPESAREPLARYLKKPSNSPLARRARREFEDCQQHDVALLQRDHPDYPALLAETPRCPPLLYLRGDPTALVLPQIAIVGTRKPSPLGQALTLDFAGALARAGFAITSGLALGIDGCAHRGAMDAGGKTLAVLGSGLHNIYPKAHAALAQDILASGGVLVSEFGLQAGAKARHFPQRNRIVSGLSCGVLVVEAALKSGSLITARFALQHNREVFAVPGSIRSEVSRGCHAMIKSGAKLVENPKDIISELTGVLGFYRDSLSKASSSHTRLKSSESAEDLLNHMPLDQGQSEVLEAIGYEQTTMDQLCERLDTDIDAIAHALLDLELQGVIENTGLGYQRRL